MKNFSKLTTSQDLLQFTSRKKRKKVVTYKFQRKKVMKEAIKKRVKLQKTTMISRKFSNKMRQITCSNSIKVLSKFRQSSEGS